MAQLTATAPAAAPAMVPRPPTATQIAISTDGRMPIEEGLMIPTWGTNRAPAKPAIAADRAKITNL